MAKATLNPVQPPLASTGIAHIIGGELFQHEAGGHLYLRTPRGAVSFSASTEYEERDFTGGRYQTLPVGAVVTLEQV